MTSTMKTALGVAAALVLSGGYAAWQITSMQNAASSTRGMTNPAALESIELLEIADMALGRADAPVTVVEYASFTCPRCADFHDEILPQLKADYIVTGKIRFVHREVFFDRAGLWASLLARCAGPERYFGVAGELYEQQQDWATGGSTEISENLKRLGRIAGLESAEIEACFSNETKATSLVAWYQDNAGADDITGTPTVLIDGEKVSTRSYADLSAAIEDALAE